MGTIKSVLKLGFLCAWIVIAAISSADAKSCTELGEDLKAMQKAQSQLLDSMVRKNDSMASTLDQYAEGLSQQKTVRKSDVVSFRKSAVAFRNHRSREEKLVQRFEKKTSELIELIEGCLNSKSLAAQTSVRSGQAQ